MSSRAKATARQLRLFGAKRGRGRLPKQIAPKRLELEYGNRLTALVMPLVEAAFEQFRREIPGLLASAHADMRLDALTMDAGEGKRIRELIAEARAKMQRTVMTSRLDDLAAMYADKTAGYQKQQLANQTRAALGANPFISDRRLVPLTQAFVDANVGHVKGLTDEVAARMEKRAIGAVQDGLLYEDFAAQIQATFDFGDNRAMLIARDQTGKLYGQLNAARQRELGVTRFVWRTSQDDRVREEHEALDGQTFDYDDPPDEGLPGEAIQCRCTAEPDFSEILDAVDDDQQ